MKFALILSAIVICSYFIGNINFSILLSRLFARHDVRDEGSGNPGTMNMLRSFGIKLGLVTLLLDALKGAVPAILGWWLVGGSPAAPMSEALSFGADKLGLFAGGVSAVLGHIFPVVFRFKGGKGVATSIGVCFVAAPVVSAIAFAAGVVFLLTVKIGCITSFIMTGVPLVYSGVTAFIGGYIAVGVMAIGLFATVLCAHHANFVRLFRGEEKRVVLFGKNKSARSAAAAREENGEDTSPDGGKNDGEQ